MNDARNLLTARQEKVVAIRLVIRGEVSRSRFASATGHERSFVDSNKLRVIPNGRRFDRRAIEAQGSLATARAARIIVGFHGIDEELDGETSILYIRENKGQARTKSLVHFPYYTI
jgi:hypothetical protein